MYHVHSVLGRSANMDPSKTTFRHRYLFLRWTGVRPMFANTAASTMYISFLYRSVSFDTLYNCFAPLPLVYFRFFFFFFFLFFVRSWNILLLKKNGYRVQETVTNGLKTRDNMKILRVLRVTVLTREPQRCTTKGRFIISRSHCKMV